MCITNALGRNSLEKLLRIVAMIDAVYIDVVEVQQDITVCFRDNGIEKFNQNYSVK
jgi:hypothetical protein